jgi:hypothetical protein
MIGLPGSFGEQAFSVSRVHLLRRADLDADHHGARPSFHSYCLLLSVFVNVFGPHRSMSQVLLKSFGVLAATSLHLGLGASS